MNIYKEDINYLIKKLEEIHPNPYLYYKKEEFYKDLENLSNKEISIENFKYELATTLAKLNDQHTFVSFLVRFLWKLKIIDDKVYIIHDYRNSNSKYLYKYIKSINNVDINEIIKKYIKVVPGKNNQWKKAMTQEFILSKSFLESIDVVKDDKFIIELSDEIRVDANKELEIKDIILLKKFDYKVILKDTFFIKYSSCKNSEHNIIENFFKEIKQNIKDNNYKNIIVDLRGNNGGNSKYFSSFAKFLNEEYKDINYYTLTDEYVFSSGIWALQEMIDLGSYVVGDIPGAKRDMFGEVVFIELPNTKIKLFCSTAYFRYEDKEFKCYAKDNIDLLKEYLDIKYVPDVIIKNNIEDYINNKDVVLDEVLYIIKNEKGDKKC